MARRGCAIAESSAADRSRQEERRLGVDNLIAIGSAVLIPAGFAMVALAALRFGSPYTIVGPMILICCGSGLITPNAVAGSLGVKVGIVGAASGLASFIQMIGAAGATAALSIGGNGNPLVLAVVIASAGLFAVMAFGLFIAGLVYFQPRVSSMYQSMQMPASQLNTQLVALGHDSLAWAPWRSDA